VAVLEVIAGIVIVSIPSIGVATLAVLIGITFVLRGLGMCVLALALRRRASTPAGSTPRCHQGGPGQVRVVAVADIHIANVQARATDPAPITPTFIAPISYPSGCARYRHAIETAAPPSAARTIAGVGTASSKKCRLNGRMKATT
jgi:hypothetical protein